MAYQNNDKLYHSALVKQGPTLAFVKGPPKTIQKKDGSGSFTKVTFTIQGKDCDYFLPNGVDSQPLLVAAGTSVLLIAQGDDRQGTATLTIGPASQGAPQQQAPPQYQQPQAPAPQQNYQPPQQAAPPPQANGLIQAKKHMAQNANLMRMAVKKAFDLGSEFGLPQEHIQGIATTLFISAERAGHAASMPLEPFTMMDLGVNANQARQHVESPQQEQDDQGNSIPF
jgi:hypothetical protein